MSEIFCRVRRPVGFGVVPMPRLRGMERYWCDGCQLVTSGIPAESDAQPTLRGLGFLRCPRCSATLVDCPECGEVTGTFVLATRRWRCDKCQGALRTEHVFTLNRKI